MTTFIVLFACLCAVFGTQGVSAQRLVSDTGRSSHSWYAQTRMPSLVYANSSGTIVAVKTAINNNGFCFYGTYSGQIKYIEITCAVSDKKNIVVRTYNPITTPNCIGQSEQVNGRDLIYADGDTIPEVFGTSRVTVTCSLGRFFDEDNEDANNFVQVRASFRGTCASLPSGSKFGPEWARVSDLWFLSTATSAISLPLETNSSETVEYPCSGSAGANCNNSICSQTSDPNIYFFPTKGSFSMTLQQWINANIDKFPYNPIPLFQWPVETESQTTFILAILLLASLFVTKTRDVYCRATVIGKSV